MKEKVYTSLCMLFCSLIIVGNMIYQKFVSLSILPFYTFQLSVGSILYPLTFLITDLISEFYGKDKAQFCVKFSMIVNILVAIIIFSMDQLPATSWSKIDDNLFHKMFGFYNIAFVASIIACYFSQSIDIYIYLFINKLTKGRYLWLRNNVSTSISLFFDTFIVNGFMAAFGILPTDNMWQIIFNSYSWKLFFTICATPFFYFLVSLIRRVLKTE